MFHKLPKHAKKDILEYVMVNWEQLNEHLNYDYSSQRWYEPFFQSTPAICGAWRREERGRRRTGEAARLVSKLHIADTQPTEVKPDMLSGRRAQMDNHLWPESTIVPGVLVAAIVHAWLCQAQPIIFQLGVGHMAAAGALRLLHALSICQGQRQTYTTSR